MRRRPAPAQPSAVADADDGPSPPHPGTATDSPSPTSAPRESDDRTKLPPPTATATATARPTPPERAATTLIIPAVASAPPVALLLWGLILRRSFYHGRECDMTWSRLRFLPLEVPGYDPAESGRPYRLWKFTDGRDPRHWHLRELVDGADGGGGESARGDGRGGALRAEDNWCLLPPGAHAPRGWAAPPVPNPGHPVLYVPGHWGEYKQARSLGAHGTTWTQRAHPAEDVRRVQGMMRDGSLSGKAEAGEGRFLMDVYTVDFGGEGAGLHGGRMVRQADFVARAIVAIAEACNATASGVTVVAHSVGGAVARSVPALHPETRPYVRDIITLATPHAHFPYAFDRSVGRFWDLATDPRTARELDLAVVSISGGRRDELIPTSLCVAEGGVSVLAPDVMPPRSDAVPDAESPSLGMDHKAIAWCHNVLSVVRGAVHALASLPPGAGAAERAERARGAMVGRGTRAKGGRGGYGDAAAAQEWRMREGHGPWRTAALDATAPYRLKAFVALYAATAALRLLLAAAPPSRPPPRTHAAGGGGPVRDLLPCLLVLTAAVAAARAVLPPSDRPPSLLVELLLAAGASVLHFALVRGLFPAMSLGRRALLRRLGRAGDVDAGAVSDRGGREIRRFLVAGGIAWAAMIGRHLAWGDAVALNRASLAALIFGALAFHAASLALSLAWWEPPPPAVPTASAGLSPLSAERRRRWRRDLAALLLPVLPFLLGGKAVYALTLVGRGGQMDAGLLSGPSLALRSEAEGRMLASFFDDLIGAAAFVLLPLCVLLGLAQGRGNP